MLCVRHKTHIGALLVVATTWAWVGVAAADDDLDDESSPIWHGFVSQGFIKTTDNNYLAGNSTRGSFEMSEAGLNITKQLGPQLRTGAQLFARKLGALGDFDAKLDWFYLDYQLADWLGIRAGRTKVPFGLYNDTSDIDAARVPVLLPQSVYPTLSRDFLLAQTGVELYGFIPAGGLGSVEYRLYSGTSFLEADVPVEVPYTSGGRLMWDTPVEGLQLGASALATRINAELELETVPGEPPEPVSYRLSAVLWLVSAAYAIDDTNVAIEYGRWHVKSVSKPMVSPDTTTTSERLYAMVTHQVSDRVTPGLYYSLEFRDVADRKSRENHQHDLAATVRVDITANLLAKLEAHMMRGTASLQPALNDDTPRDQLDKVWGVILAKATAYF